METDNLENFSDTESYTSSYTDTYSDSYTYSSGSFTDSGEFNDKLEDFQEESEPLPELTDTKLKIVDLEIEQIEISREEHFGETEILNLSQDFSNELEVTESDLDMSLENMADVTVIEQIMLEVKAVEEMQDIQIEIEPKTHEFEISVENLEETLTKSQIFDRIPEEPIRKKEIFVQNTKEPIKESEHFIEEICDSMISIKSLEEPVDRPVVLDDFQFDQENQMKSESGMFSSDLIVRTRSMSQESYHSQPKSWTDFQADTKQWRPVGRSRVNSSEPDENYTKSHVSNQSATNIGSDYSAEMSVNMSEGYRSSSSRDVPAEKNNKSRIRTKSYERPRRNMDEFLKTIIPTVESSGTEINILRTESNESSLLFSEENTEIEEISRETKENQTYLSIKKRKNSVGSSGSESIHSDIHKSFDKILRVKVTRREDNSYAYGYETITATPQRRSFVTSGSEIDEKSTTETFVQSDNFVYKPRIYQRKLPERKDTFTRKFDQIETSAMSGMKSVYNRHSQKASKLLMDLQISMASNGYGKYRNQKNY